MRPIVLMLVVGLIAGCGGTTETVPESVSTKPGSSKPEADKTVPETKSTVAKKAESTDTNPTTGIVQVKAEEKAPSIENSNKTKPPEAIQKKPEETEFIED
jgi:hypothetical protein